MIDAIDLDFIQRAGSYLTRFKQKSADVWNYRCFSCGDSKKNKFKARGFILVQKGKIFAKCHNCDYCEPFDRFLDDLEPDLGKKYRFEKFKSRGSETQPIVSERPRRKSSRSFTFGNCVKLSDISIYHPAREFLLARKITDHSRFWFTDNFEQLVHSIPEYAERELKKNEPRIIIPFFNRKGKLFAFQGRSIEKGCTLRYITIKLDPDYPLIYNFDRANLHERLYVTEGPLDSLFLPNAIAVAGSDFQKLDVTEIKERLVVVLDNEPRNKEIVAKYKKMLDLGFQVCIWPKEIKQKDINDMIIAGKDPKQIVEIIDSNIYTKLKGNITLGQWSKV